MRYSQGTAPLPAPLTPATALTGASDELPFWAKTRPREGEVGVSKANTGVVALLKKWCVERVRSEGSKGAVGSAGRGYCRARLGSRLRRSG